MRIIIDTDPAMGTLGGDPEFAASLKGIVMMGGTAECAGNASPAAEFNYWQDTEAADIVFRSQAGLTMVGLDVCQQTHLSPKQVEECASKGMSVSHHKPFQRVIFDHPRTNTKVEFFCRTVSCKFRADIAGAFIRC